MEELQPWWYLSQKPHLLAIHQLCNVASRLAKESVLDGYRPNDDEIEWKEDPFFAVDHSSEDPIEKILIFGSPQLQRSIRQLCFEFRDIFSVTVKSEPAKVPPMDLKLNPDKWHSNKNRGPPRPQSEVRRLATEKTVKKYLELGVIAPSTASEYSQVHLVPKEEPNDWRFCLDYVRLNQATVGVESSPNDSKNRIQTTQGVWGHGYDIGVSSDAPLRGSTSPECFYLLHGSISLAASPDGTEKRRIKYKLI